MRSGIYGSIITMVILCAPALAYDWSTNPGSGTPENPYQINEPNHLIAIGANPDLLDKCFILTNDIIFDPINNPAHVFTQALIAPDIDPSQLLFQGNSFTGVFDGSNCVILNLMIVSPDNDYLGLFGDLVMGGQIKNLGIKNANISGHSGVGILAGYNWSGSISRCHVEGVIDGYNEIGGLVGGNYSTITQSYSAAVVTGYGELIGGLAGRNISTITECYVTGDVDGNNRVGGLVGSNEGTVHKCYNRGDVSGDYFIGGSVGTNKGTISQCYTARQEIDGNSDTGGLVGSNIGGIITDCYTSSSVTGYVRIGGLVGQNQEGTINNCYVIGQILGQGSYVGAFVGYNDGTINSSFWDVEISGISDGVGNENPDPSGVTGIATSQMYTEITFTDAEWDFSDDDGNPAVWQIAPCNYPGLAWETDIHKYSCGCGTTTDPYQINSAEDWQELIENPRDWSSHFILTDDIDLSGIQYLVPIASDTASYLSGFQGTVFTGVFDGKGHNISNATINTPGSMYTGLFGCLGVNGVIKHVGVTNLNLSGKWYVGGLVGYNKGTINDCFATVEIEGKNYVGGLVGVHSLGTILNCYAIGQVMGDQYVGGLTGYSSSIIINCHGSGSIIGERDYVGGLSGILAGSKIQRCYATGLVVGDVYNTGGLVGWSDGTITECYASASVAGDQAVGGLVGGNGFAGTISNCYSTGNVTGYQYVGGLCGGNSSGNIENCYSTGYITANAWGNGFVGAVAGGSITDNSWYIETSGKTTGYAVYDDRESTITNLLGFTSSQMYQSSSFINDINWDFVGESVKGENEIWRMCADGVDYPRLSWEFARNGDFACGDAVDLADLQALAGHWLTSTAIEPDTFNTAVDANGDEQIDLADFDILSENWPSSVPIVE